MMKLNSNYSALKEQAIKLGKSFSDNDSDFIAFLKSTSLYSLEFFGVFLGEGLPEFDDNTNYERGFLVSDMLEVRCIQSLLKDADFHQKIFSAVFALKEQAIDLARPMTDEESSYVFNNEDIFHFLENQFPQAIKTYENLMKNGSVYGFPGCKVIFGAEGFTLFNYLENRANIFIDTLSNDYTMTKVLVHELGHVFDIESGYFRYGILGKQSLSDLSTFSEVISCAFQQRFLKFLADNDSAGYDRNFYLNYIQSLFMLAENASISLNNLPQSNNFQNSIFPINWAYGGLIANMIVNGEISLDNFFEAREKGFSRESLEELGVQPESVSKSVQKTLAKCRNN